MTLVKQLKMADESREVEEGKLITIFEGVVKQVDDNAGLVRCRVMDLSDNKHYDFDFEIRPSDAHVQAGDRIRYLLYRKDNKLSLKQEKLPESGLFPEFCFNVAQQRASD